MATLLKKMKKNNYVKKDYAKISNELLEAFVRKNNRTALKIIFYIARADIDIVDTELYNITLNSKQLCDYCEIDMRTLKRNIRSMTETSISITNDEETAYMSVLPKAIFSARGDLKIKVFKEVVTLIKEVKDKSTVIDARQVMMLNSKHSIRMLMLLEYINTFSEECAKRKHYDLDELNALFGTKYKKLIEFERKILIPVKAELDSFSKLSFIYEAQSEALKSAGRPRLTHITIDLIDNLPQGRLF